MYWGLSVLCWRVIEGVSGWLGRRKWIGMGIVMMLGSCRLPGRLLRECRSFPMSKVGI
jgi:hypothetical protein